MRPAAQLTLPLSTISFCRLVDAVTRSRMACQDPDVCHPRGPGQAQGPPWVPAGHSPSSGLCRS